MSNGRIDCHRLISYFFMLTLSIVVLMGTNTAQASERADAAWQALANGAALIDVRTEQEFATEHLDAALNMPLSDIGKLAESLDRNTTVVVYCRSGNRASHAKQQLHKMGFDQVINGGGLEEMKASKP